MIRSVARRRTATVPAMTKTITITWKRLSSLSQSLVTTSSRSRCGAYYGAGWHGRLQLGNTVSSFSSSVQHEDGESLAHIPVSPPPPGAAAASSFVSIPLDGSTTTTTPPTTTEDGVEEKSKQQQDSIVDNNDSHKATANLDASNSDRLEAEISDNDHNHREQHQHQHDQQHQHQHDQQRQLERIGNTDIELLRQQTATLVSVDIPYGKFSPAMWEEAGQLLYLWTDKHVLCHSPESVDQSFALLDRLVFEQQVQEYHPLSLQILGTPILRLVVNNWNRCMRKFHSYSVEDQAILRYEFTPMEVLERLEDYSDRSPRLQFDTKCLNIIIDAAGRCSVASPTGTPGIMSPRVATSFVQSLFDRMVATAKFRDEQEGKHPIMSDDHYDENNFSNDTYNQSIMQEKERDMEMMRTSLQPENSESSKNQPHLLGSQNYHHRLPSTRPDLATYSSIIYLLSLHGIAARAEEMLNLLYKEYQTTNNERYKPDVPVFTTVLMAWSRSEEPYAPERAETLLQHMQELSDSGVLPVAPDLLAYNVVLSCFARRVENQFKNRNRTARMRENREAIMKTLQRARDFFSHMESVGCTGTVSYNILLNAFAQAGMPLEVEKMVAQMHQAVAIGSQILMPNNSTYNALLLAWKNSRNAKCGDRALEILTEFEELYQTGKVSEPPNLITYNSVLSCLAEARQGDRAEALLQRMKQERFAHGVCIAPDAISWNTVINAHGRSHHPRKAEALLEAMYQEFLATEGNNQHLQPGIEGFTSVLRAWMNSEEPCAAERANSILNTMHNLYDAKVLNVAPNAIAYNIVINCWCRSKDPQSPQNAYQILKKMEALHNGGSSSVRPDEMSYAAVIKAFADRGEASRAEEILESMHLQSLPILRGGGGNTRARPLPSSYNKVFGAYCRVGDKKAAERSELLWKRWRSRFESEMTQYAPDVLSAHLVLMTWRTASKHDPTAGQRAQSFLQDVEQLASSGTVKPNVKFYKILFQIFADLKDAKRAHKCFVWMCNESEKGETRLAPEVEMFDMVLATWWASGSPDAAKKADELFRKVYELSDAKVLAWTPSSASFRIFLACLEENPSSWAGMTANTILQEMQGQYESGSKEMKPLPRDYAQVIRIWSKVQHEDAVFLADTAFRKLKSVYDAGDEHYKPDINVYNTIIDAWSRSDYIEAKERVHELQRDLEILKIEEQSTTAQMKMKQDNAK